MKPNDLLIYALGIAGALAGYFLLAPPLSWAAIGICAAFALWTLFATNGGAKPVLRLAGLSWSMEDFVRGWLITGVGVKVGVGIGVSVAAAICSTATGSSASGAAGWASGASSCEQPATIKKTRIKTPKKINFGLIGVFINISLSKLLQNTLPIFYKIMGEIALSSNKYEL